MSAQSCSTYSPSLAGAPSSYAFFEPHELHPPEGPQPLALPPDSQSHAPLPEHSQPPLQPPVKADPARPQPQVPHSQSATGRS